MKCFNTLSAASARDPHSSVGKSSLIRASNALPIAAKNIRCSFGASRSMRLRWRKSIPLRMSLSLLRVAASNLSGLKRDIFLSLSTSLVCFHGVLNETLEAEMPRVTTRGVQTEMIDRLPLWDRTAEESVEEPMVPEDSVAESRLAVPIGVLVTLPDPATFLILQNLRQQFLDFSDSRLNLQPLG